MSELFNDIDSTNKISINIQKNRSEIVGFEKTFAVSLSECVIDPNDFWNQKQETISFKIISKSI